MMAQIIAEKRRELHQLQHTLISEILRTSSEKSGTGRVGQTVSLRAIIDTKREELKALEKRPTV